MKFAYYPGCASDGSGIEYGLSMERTAKILGFELQELEDWNCCGATSGHNTNKLLSLALPARNLAIAEKSGLNMMVAPCAACYSRHRYAEHTVQHDPEMKKKIEAVIDMELQGNSETLSILDVLVNKIGVEAIAAKVKSPLTTMKAASYYGCLLVRPVEHTGFDDPEDPQTMDQIMQALGAEPVEWSHKTECCGAALVTSRPDVGMTMLYRVLKDAKESGAECLVTACPLCMLNLDMRQAAVEKQFGEKFQLPIYYITELLALACGDEPKQVGLEKHFVEAGQFLQTVKLRAAEAKAAAERAAQEAAEKARAKAEAAAAAKAKTSGEPEKTAAKPAAEVDQKKIDGFVAAFTKNPDKMAAKLVADPAQAGILVSVLDSKKIAKLAGLMAKDMQLAQKAAGAFVQAELKRQGECQD
ncbi:MAG: CoB--CoM heterodisulfide reductase iron-sulfur subunit B family protein [Syntrophomonadaceae bacterium]|nr:CoB--CoM heterodisulfide reductase iron-sulfur subunit B family protein [Syntrophomonadaceae bacterium]